MIIQPSKNDRRIIMRLPNYAKTSKPVFLTKIGEIDLVVMGIKTYNRKGRMLKLREQLLTVEANKINGNKGYSIEEVSTMMQSATAQAQNLIKPE